MNNIEIKNVSKKYDGFLLDKISFDVPAGSIVGLIGENGAGKTTTIKSILNIIKSEGTVKIFNKDINQNEKEIKQNIGVVLDDSFLSTYLTPKYINSVMKEFYKNWDEEKYNKLLKQFGLPSDKLIKDFSSGMKMKLKIATAISHNPKLLILDEPTSGLDPVVRNEVLDLFLEFIQDEQHTILFSTHITSDLEHISDYIIFLDQGQIILEEERDVLQNEYGILKCGLKEFEQVDPKDYLYYKKGKYQCEMLVKEKNKIQKKYKSMVIDPITLEELMILTIKGVKSC